jgi:hypothetical protein
MTVFADGEFDCARFSGENNRLAGGKLKDPINLLELHMQQTPVTSFVIDDQRDIRIDDTGMYDPRMWTELSKHLVGDVYSRRRNL